MSCDQEHKGRSKYCPVAKTFLCKSCEEDGSHKDCRKNHTSSRAHAQEVLAKLEKLLKSLPKKAEDEEREADMAKEEFFSCLRDGVQSCIEAVSKRGKDCPAAEESKTGTEGDPTKLADEADQLVYDTDQLIRAIKAPLDEKSDDDDNLNTLIKECSFDEKIIQMSPELSEYLSKLKEKPKEQGPAHFQKADCPVILAKFERSLNYSSAMLLQVLPSDSSVRVFYPNDPTAEEKCKPGKPLSVGHGIAFCQVETENDRCLCITGGTDDFFTTTKSAKCFSYEKKTVIELKPMNVPRKNHCLVYSKGQNSIFAIGGYNEADKCLCSVEQLDLSSPDNEWKLRDDLSLACPTDCATAYVDEETVYVFGSRNKEGKWVEKISLSGKVEKLCQFGVANCGVAPLEGKQLLLFGGHKLDKETVRSKATEAGDTYVFDMEKGTIEDVKRMKLSRSDTFQYGLCYFDKVRNAVVALSDNHRLHMLTKIFADTRLFVR